MWPSTRKQRRASHAASQVRRCTTLKPKLEAGIELLGIANKLKDGTLFAFVETQQERGGKWPSANNAVESRNVRLREMLRRHRGLPLMHRTKATFW